MVSETNVVPCPSRFYSLWGLYQGNSIYHTVIPLIEEVQDAMRV